MQQFRPDQTGKGFRQLRSVQFWLGVATFLCMIFLVLRVFLVSPTAVNSQKNSATATSSDLSLTQTRQVENLSVVLAVAPGKINVANTITVKITDTRSDQFVTDASIVISVNMDQMDMGTVRSSMTGGTPAYSATFVQDTTFSMTGTWDITLTIDLPQQAQSTATFQVWLSG